MNGSLLASRQLGSFRSGTDAVPRSLFVPCYLRRDVRIAAVVAPNLAAPLQAVLKFIIAKDAPCCACSLYFRGIPAVVLRLCKAERPKRRPCPTPIVRLHYCTSYQDQSPGLLGAGRGFSKQQQAPLSVAVSSSTACPAELQPCTCFNLCTLLRV